MPDAPDHDVEPSLFAALASHGALAFEPAAAFNEVTALAARLCQTPMAALGFAHAQQHWCQSSHGVSLASTQREPSFLTPGLAQKGMLVVPDAVSDPRFSKDPITIGGEPLRFYASVPITLDEDRGLGVLCVLDHQPREAGLSDDQRTHLQSLAQLTLRVAKLHHAYLIERASLRESVHRTRNIISVVQALVMRTLTSASSQEEAASTLMGRLDALGSVQDTLLAEGREGVDLRNLVVQQLAPFMDEADRRLTMKGPDATIDASAAEAIGMAIHELATNATKHGALSNDSGDVSILWKPSASGELVFQWTEKSGGDAPLLPLKEKGFGSTLLGPLTAERIGGEAKLELGAEGASWSASIAPHLVIYLGKDD